MNALLIGVVSDTHVPARARALPAQLFDAFADVDMILHAGDLVSESVLTELEALAPVHAVCGNMDPPELARRLPRTKMIEAAGVKIGLIHGDGRGGSTVERAYQAFPDADCIVFGHSHTPHLERRGKTLLFNPGSPTDRRREPKHSYGFLEIEDGRVEGRIVRF